MVSMNDSLVFSRSFLKVHAPPAASMSPIHDARLNLIFTSLACLFVIFDMANMSSSEKNLVWKAPRTFSTTTYKFTRCFTLLSQTVTLCFSFYKISTPTTREVCEAWLSIEAVAIHTLIAVVQIVLMWRVYALYDKNRFIVALLAIVFAANIGASVVFWKTVLKHIDFDERCTPGGEPQFETVYMAVFIIISHFFFWGLEFFKLQTFVWRRVVLAVPRLASLLMKDGALIFIGFSGVLASSLAYTFRVRQMAHVILPIITSFLSIATCRMIMRYLTLGSQVGASHSSGSDYDLSCWDTDTIERIVSVQVIDIDGDMGIRTVHRINTNNHTTPSIQ